MEDVLINGVYIRVREKYQNTSWKDIETRAVEKFAYWA